MVSMNQGFKKKKNETGTEIYMVEKKKDCVCLFYAKLIRALLD